MASAAILFVMLKAKKCPCKIIDGKQVPTVCVGTRNDMIKSEQQFNLVAIWQQITERANGDDQKNCPTGSKNPSVRNRESLAVSLLPLSYYAPPIIISNTIVMTLQAITGTFKYWTACSRPTS